MNKVMLIGNVGREPEVRYYDVDQALAILSLATSERGYRLPDGTEIAERTDWHTVLLYRGLAKFAERYVHTGDRIYVEGRLRYRSIDDAHGKRCLVAEIYADSMELLSSKMDVAVPKDLLRR